MATVLLAALLGGCSFLSKEADATEVSSKAETESPGATQESETETAETEETQESHEAAEDEESGEVSKSIFPSGLYCCCPLDSNKLSARLSFCSGARFLSFAFLVKSFSA